MIREQIQERLRALDRREAVGLAVIALLLVSGAVVWYVRSLPSRVEIATSVPASTGSSPSPAAAPSASPPRATIYVHVAGRVRHPGVYGFHEGDRVIDAIRRAGGARSHADLRSINLAAPLTDGLQIVVVRRVPGGPEPPASGTSSGAGSGSGGTGSGSGDLVNLNTATLDELETLPGIGEVLGQRIIDYRDQHGPFGAIEDLMNVSGIGDQRFADLKSLITV